MAQRNLSLIIVDAVSSFIDDDKAIAQPNIQEIIDSGIVLSNDIYEFFITPSDLKHQGRKIERGYREGFKIEDIVNKIERVDREDFKIEDVANEVILVGGSLGNEHLGAFITLLKKLRERKQIPIFHIPLDCTYSFENRYDSGESWTVGCLGDISWPILERYNEAMMQYGSGAYVIKVDGEVRESSPVTELKFWTKWRKLADYLANVHS